MTVRNLRLRQDAHRLQQAAVSFQLHAARPSVAPPLLRQRSGIGTAGFHVLVSQTWPIMSRRAWHGIPRHLRAEPLCLPPGEPSNTIDCVNEHVAVTRASGVETFSPQWGLLSAELKQYHLPAKIPGALSCLLGLLQ